MSNYRQIPIKESMKAQRDPILGGWADGYRHVPYRESGYCSSCDCRPGQYHYRLLSRHRDTPIYDRLMRGIAYAND